MQLLASGTGQTSRVDACINQSIRPKALVLIYEGSKRCFFPFPDCVEIADKEGIKAVIQPGDPLKTD